MSRRRVLIALVAVAVVVAGFRVATTPASIAGYRLIDDHNLAIEVIGAHPTWRTVTVLAETPTTVTVGISEITLQIAPGFDDRIAYVVVQLAEPLGTRELVNAENGSEISRVRP